MSRQMNVADAKQQFPLWEKAPSCSRDFIIAHGVFVAKCTRFGNRGYKTGIAGCQVNPKHVASKASVKHSHSDQALELKPNSSRPQTFKFATPCYNTAVNDAAWMREALAEAEQALAHGDVPVGAVAVREGVIVGRGHNRKEIDADPTAHAEMIALQEAARSLGGWRLVGVTLYCTLEPCPMCAGAMVSARLPRLVYGALDPKAGAAGSVVELLRDPRLNHQVAVTGGVLAEESQALLEQFFARLRKNRERE